MAIWPQRFFTCQHCYFLICSTNSSHFFLGMPFKYILVCYHLFFLNLCIKKFIYWWSRRDTLLRFSFSVITYQNFLKYQKFSLAIFKMSIFFLNLAALSLPSDSFLIVKLFFICYVLLILLTSFFFSILKS